MSELQYASRRREEFIDLQPGERKAWRLPPCTRGFINIAIHYAGSSSNEGSGGSDVPDPGWIARYRTPAGPGYVFENEVGGESGLASELTLVLSNGSNVIAQSDANHPGSVTFDASNFEGPGADWILQVTRPNFGATTSQRYRVTVVYPSVLPVITRKISASFFERGFKENWNDNPYLEQVQIRDNRVTYVWNKQFALYYRKPTDPQYIDIPASDWYTLPTIFMSSITLSVNGGMGPFQTEEFEHNPQPYLMLEMKCRCENSRTIEFEIPGPNILPSIDLPQEFPIKIKLFLDTAGAYNSPSLIYNAVVESELLEIINYDVTYPTLSGIKTINLKTEAKAFIEKKLSSVGQNFFNDFVRPYFVGQLDLYSIGWQRETRDILVSYVGEQKRPEPVVSTHGGPLGGPGVGTSDENEQGGPHTELPRLFETPVEMPLSSGGFPRTIQVNPGNLAKINHIVVLMQENRSFDQVLGYLSRDGMLPRDKLLDGDESAGRVSLQTHVDGLLPESDPPAPHHRDVNSYNNVDYFSARRRTTGWPSYALHGPAHGAEAVTRQVSDSMKGFVKDWARHASSATYNPGANDPSDPLQLVMDYLTDAELPAFGALTWDFAICDRWHCSHLGGTLPNRFISLTGDFSRDIFGSPEVENPDLAGFSPLREPTFFDHLTASGVDWKLFEHGYSMLRLVQKYTFEEEKIQSFSKFEETVAAGLPPVTFIEPNYIESPVGISNDDHAPADMKNGQILIAQIMRALLANPAQWAETLFLITYDEHGGFYDHVQPPTHVEKVNSDGSVTQVPIPTLSVGEPRLGVRVPAFVISPFIPGAGPDDTVNVSHALFDHTSIPATILRRFCPQKAPFMGDRWAAANDVGPLLTLDTPRPDADFDQLRREMADIATFQTELFRGDPSKIVQPPLRKPQTADAIEEDFAGLIAFASSMTGRGAEP